MLNSHGYRGSKDSMCKNTYLLKDLRFDKYWVDSIYINCFLQTG